MDVERLPTHSTETMAGPTMGVGWCDRIDDASLTAVDELPGEWRRRHTGP